MSLYSYWDEHEDELLVVTYAEGDSYLCSLEAEFESDNGDEHEMGDPGYDEFHDLRHTFATIAVASSVDIKTVSVLLGNADPAMTLRVYADSLEDGKRAGMERLDGIL